MLGLRAIDFALAPSVLYEMAVKFESTIRSFLFGAVIESLPFAEKIIL
jgi:hypothetical protein